MASIRLPVSSDAFDSKKSNFSVNPLHASGSCTFYSISSYIHFTRACIITSLSRFSSIKVSRIGAELSENDTFRDLVSENIGGDAIDRNQDSSRATRKRHWGPKKWTKRDMGSHLSPKKNAENDDTDGLLMFAGELDADYSVLESDISLEQCNAILKKLERSSSKIKTLSFFEWMKRNGKLQKNITAYNIILRVLARQQEWDSAERMVRELSDSFGSELDSRVFNTLIYPCSKRGHVELCRKWFRMMLELGVKPNIATFGMLMGVYQKGWNVDEAEFTFAQMRNARIVCHSAYSAMITIYTRLNLHDKAEEIICAMKEDKVVPNLENWLVLLNAYSQQGKLEEAERVLASMLEARFSPNIVAYNMLITGYGKVSNMADAQRLFLSIKDIGLEPDETTYRSMIEGWGRAGNHKQAEWHYKELRRLGFKPNSSNLYTLINLQAQHGDEEGAGRTLDDMLKMGCQHSSVIGTVLKAYERAGRISKVPLILKGSFYQHVLVNQNSCSILAIAYVKHSLVDDALKVLGEKEWKDRLFEDNLYHLLICSCKELGQLENAVKIYTQMPKRDKPNLHILCTMMDIYSVLGLLMESEKLYLELKSHGIALDVIAFSVVIRMYVKAGRLVDACSVLETMETEDSIVPDIYLFRDMLRIYQQCGMTSKLNDLYYKILGSDVVWDQELYNCLINCCARALPVSELSRLFNEMLQRGFSPNSHTFNVMLDVYGKSKLFEKVRELFWMAKKRGLVDVVSYNTIIAAYGRSKELEKMVSTVRHMQFDGFSVSLEAYNCMLDAYGKGGQMESFKSVLQRMKESRCSSDHYTYNIMMNIYGERGWIDEIGNVLLELKESGLGPDLCSYNTLIKAYGIAGMVEDAVRLLKEMREKGVEPDKITYTNLITALRRNDKYLEAVKWSLWMKQMGL